MNGFYETGPTVKVGDRYRDRDKRMGNRVLEVTSITQDRVHAYLVQVVNERRMPGRTPRISVDRLLTKHLFEKVK